jgi:chromosome segregation ATPase
MAEKSRPRSDGTASVNARGVGAGASTGADMGGTPSGTAADRRKRVALRRLIDEMLAEIRAAANEENWTDDARAQAESDLARIMDQVRREAMRAEPKPKAKRAKPR